MNDPIYDFLAQYSPEIQAICQRMRVLVKQARVGGQEVLYASQSHFDFSISGKASEAVMYITPMKDYARLGFFWGGYLPDPLGLLVGEGKRLRHIKIHLLQETGQPGLEELIAAAWSDAGDRFGMVK